MHFWPRITKIHQRAWWTSNWSLGCVRPFYRLGAAKMSLRNYRKVYKTPRHTFEKERLDEECKIVGEYGLRCKREVYRVNTMLTKVRLFNTVLEFHL